MLKNKINKITLSNYVILLLIIIGVLMVFYFSWVSSPRLGTNILVPEFIANWVDKYEYGKRRTGIPLFFLGVFSGFLLILKKSHVKWWILVCILLFLLVVFAEVGQFFRPSRVFDKGDIKWGVLGSTIGLCIMYGLFMFLKLIKVIK